MTNEVMKDLNNKFDIDNLIVTLNSKVEKEIEEEKAQGLIVLFRDNNDTHLTLMGSGVNVLNMAQDITIEVIRGVLEDVPEERKEEFKQTVILRFAALLNKHI